MEAPKKTVLVVDDTVENIQLLKEVLSPTFRLKVAMNGEKALQIALGDSQPDLILLDVMMPGLDGFEVCRRLKKDPKTEKIPVIFITARSEEHDETEGFAAGAIDYVTKPISPAVVSARVHTHLALSAARQELEKQNLILQENIRLKEQVDQILRHDLKTPLSAFIGIPQMLLKRQDIPGNVREMLSVLEKTGFRMMSMINRAMDIYKIESGTYELRPVPVDLIRIVYQIRKELEDLFASKECSFEVLLEGIPVGLEKIFEIPGEEMLFYSMLGNLIKNAVEASPEKGKITVGFGTHPCPFVYIQNAGLIPAEIRGRFMEKYHTSGKPKGLGLGAYSAKLMAGVLGGKISFTSAEPEGTVIRIEFPTVQKDLAETLEGVRITPQTSSPYAWIRTLIIDTNELMRSVIRQTLLGIGINLIYEAKNLKEGREIVLKNKADLIVADWNLPDGEGCDFLDWVRSLSPVKEAFFIIMGEDLDVVKLKKAVFRQVSDILRKPFSPDILKKKIEKFAQSRLRAKDSPK